MQATANDCSEWPSLVTPLLWHDGMKMTVNWREKERKLHQRVMKLSALVLRFCCGFFFDIVLRGKSNWEAGGRFIALLLCCSLLRSRLVGAKCNKMRSKQFGRKQTALNKWAAKVALNEQQTGDIDESNDKKRWGLKCFRKFGNQNCVSFPRRFNKSCKYDKTIWKGYKKIKKKQTAICDARL